MIWAGSASGGQQGRHAAVCSCWLCPGPTHATLVLLLQNASPPALTAPSWTLAGGKMGYEIPVNGTELWKGALAHSRQQSAHKSGSWVSCRAGPQPVEWPRKEAQCVLLPPRLASPGQAASGGLKYLPARFCSHETRAWRAVQGQIFSVSSLQETEKHPWVKAPHQPETCAAESPFCCPFHVLLHYPGTKAGSRQALGRSHSTGHHVSLGTAPQSICTSALVLLRGTHPCLGPAAPGSVPKHRADTSPGDPTASAPCLDVPSSLAPHM